MYKFEINKAYSIEYKQKEKDSYYTSFKGLCTECFEDKAVFRTAEQSVWGDNKQEINKNYFDIKVSEISYVDFCEIFIGNLEDNIKEAKGSFEKTKSRYNEGKRFINNRSFLGKLKNYLGINFYRENSDNLPF